MTENHTFVLRLLPNLNDEDLQKLYEEMEPTINRRIAQVRDTVLIRDAMERLIDQRRHQNREIEQCRKQ